MAHHTGVTGSGLRSRNASLRRQAKQSRPRKSQIGLILAFWVDSGCLRDGRFPAGILRAARSTFPLAFRAFLPYGNPAGDHIVQPAKPCGGQQLRVSIAAPLTKATMPWLCFDHRPSPWHGLHYALALKQNALDITQLRRGNHSTLIWWSGAASQTDILAMWKLSAPDRRCDRKPRPAARRRESSQSVRRS